MPFFLSTQKTSGRSPRAGSGWSQQNVGAKVFIRARDFLGVIERGNALDGIKASGGRLDLEDFVFLLRRIVKVALAIGLVASTQSRVVPQLLSPFLVFGFFRKQFECAVAGVAQLERADAAAGLDRVSLARGEWRSTVVRGGTA